MVAVKVGLLILLPCVKVGLLVGISVTLRPVHAAPAICVTPVAPFNPMVGLTGNVIVEAAASVGITSSTPSLLANNAF